MTQDTTWTAAMSEVYDRMLGPMTFEPYATRLAEIARELQPQRVMEIAAGSGIVTAALVGALPDAEITATDLNQGMVDYGEQRVPGATWRAADAQDLPFEDSSFDLVVCQFGAMFFPDKVAAFAETARVLSPGGRFLLAIWDVLATSDFEVALTASVASVLDDDQPSFLERVPHGYADPGQIRADLTAGGLEIDDLERLVLKTSAPSAAWIVEGYCQGSPLRFALEQAGSLPELTEAIATELTSRLGEGPVTGEMAAFVVTARKP
ncbi:MAG: ubiE 4 [Frankiales bacterium]|nr:ubiE 4 [Frankiales bacterium]